MIMNIQSVYACIHKIWTCLSVTRFQLNLAHARTVEYYTRNSGKQSNTWLVVKHVDSWVRPYYLIYIGARLKSILWACHAFISAKSKINHILCGSAVAQTFFQASLLSVLSLMLSLPLASSRLCPCCQCRHWSLSSVTWNTYCLVGRVVG